MVDLRAREEAADDVEPFVEQFRPQPRLAWLAEGGELALDPAEPDAEDRPAAAQPVERERLLRKHVRPPPRDRRDRGSE